MNIDDMFYTGKGPTEFMNHPTGCDESISFIERFWDYYYRIPTQILFDVKHEFLESLLFLSRFT